MQGYLVVNTIVGGQTLAEVSDHLNATLGIVIIAITSLIVRFAAVSNMLQNLICIAIRSPSVAAKSSIGKTTVVKSPSNH